MFNCCLSGLPDDPLVDAEIWRYVLTLGTPGQGGQPGVPFDLTGSGLAMVLRERGNWQVVSAMATDPGWRNDDVTSLDGAITLIDAANGKVLITSDPWLRRYRVPVVGWGSASRMTSVEGDVLRLASGDANARPEYLGFLRFPLRASTTQWPAPT